MPRARSPVRPRAPVVAASPPEPTLASTVVDRLRAEIVHGSLPPGEKLRLEHIATRYGVGRTPLREACCRLAAEGLVSIEDQRGFRVTPISRADLLDLTRTRQQIESLALRSSITRGGLAWEADVTAAHRRLQRVPRSAQPGPRRSPPTLDREWEAEHGRFHAALLGACDSPWLLRFHALLFGQSERYRRLSIARSAPQRDIAGEHEALAQAALARDVERACALLVEHIARTAERVLNMPAALTDEAVTPTAMAAMMAAARPRLRMSTK